MNFIVVKITQTEICVPQHIRDAKCWGHQQTIAIHKIDEEVHAPDLPKLTAIYSGILERLLTEP